MIYQLLIAFAIYAISFCMMENTVYRIDANNVKQLSIMPIFTEGLIGPVRSLYLSLRYGGIKSFTYYLLDLALNFHNMLGSTLFVLYMEQLIYNNIYCKEPELCK